MSNINNNMQTQTSNTLHNAIIKAGSKDRWKEKPILDAEGNPTNSADKVFETYKNVTQEIRDQLNTEAEAVQIILTGTDNDIYSTVDACLNACEMWKAIERLKQEWQRFVTLVKQSQELKNVSYHKLYDILKQHQHEVNEIQAKKIARVANPLALVAQQQQVYHPQTHPTHYNQHSSTRTHQSATRKREKATINSPQPIYDQEPSMVDDDDETSKEKEIDKLMALISLSFKKIYKPTNNNLRTSSNTSRAHQDNSPWIYRNTGYESQRNGNVAGARETVGSLMVQKSRIQCYNCKEYGHVARECQKPKRAKDAAYHREKMLLCKQEEAGIQLNTEQADWKDDTDNESDDQELEAHYIEKIDQNEEDADLAKEHSLRSQLETQKTQFSNEIDRLSREYYYADHMNAILGVYTKIDEVTNLQCDYLELLQKCECLETELSKSKMIPQLKSNPQGDRVLRSNSRGKKLEVEAHRRNVKFPKNKTSVTA
nr:hypothetical protein [Tanacetum cinerariifolium]